MTIALIVLSIICITVLYLYVTTNSRLSKQKVESAVMKEAESRRQDEIQRLKQSYEERIQQINLQNSKQSEELKSLQAQQIAQLKEVQGEQIELLKKQYADQIAQLKEHHARQQEETEARFRVMATEIMTNQSETLRSQNEERLGALLNPLKDNIESFRKEVNECYNAEARERTTLQERIKDLIKANDSIGKEAKELANALKGNSKTQGDWGEMILQRILENSGLREGEEFETQVTRDEDGNTLRDSEGHLLRPDVVVNYPGGKKVVIDSKVSLTAFVEMVNTTDPEEYARLGRQHLDSIRKHIQELSDKKYEEYVGVSRKLDFVMMFVPNEGAYSAAVGLDPNLWEWAYQRRVLIVSPTQLIGSLRIINQLWVNERQTVNALNIAQKSGDLYDKFVGFLSDMEDIRKALEKGQNACDNAVKKLSTGRGNLVRKAEELRDLGIKAQKRIPASYLDNDDTAITD